MTTPFDLSYLPPPVHACHEKAVFLLKFSGLSRVAKHEKQVGHSAAFPAL